METSTSLGGSKSSSSGGREHLISPAEIETALGDCAELSECKAVGVPDRHYGEEVCLCVVRREGARWRRRRSGSS